MLRFKMQDGKVVEVAETHQAGEGWIDRHSFTSLEFAADIALQVSALKGKTFIATNNPHCRPQFDIVELPSIGDNVSGYFNGDSYPEGEVTSISKSYKVIETSTGKRFYRKRQTGSWISNGTWSLIGGHHNTRNPSF